ncbi:MAG TPA: hypothetical protein VGP93_17095 [Polyangiaceae bacterium]|nr:hypothetical protein [Polyangiaceae bacterium]
MASEVRRQKFRGRHPLLLGALLGLGLSGCSWGRFDDVTKSAPIAMLKKPGAMHAGFGVSTLTATDGDRVLLFVGGATGVSAVASFDLGTGQSPTTDAKTSEYCDGTLGVCFLGQPPAALRQLEIDTGTGAEPHDFCVALGLGSTPVQGNGLVVRCDDTRLFTLPIPPSFQEDADFAIETKQAEILTQASEDAESPWLLAAASSHQLAWFYRFGSLEPEVVKPPGSPPQSYGKALAAMAHGSQHLLLVAAPDEGELFMFRASDSDLALEFVGCLGGTPGFGTALTTGVVLGDDDVPDLVVSDSHSVHVFDGQTLLNLPKTNGNVCSLGALPAGGLISSFSCGSTDDISGCGNSSFGAAVAVGDLDGDGDGEVVVGAPGMTVRGKTTAGAVLVWDLEKRGETTFAEAKFISSAAENDQLGASLALPRLGERNIIAAGAPGNGKVALFYCSGILPGELRGDRCK